VCSVGGVYPAFHVSFERLIIHWSHFGPPVPRQPLRSCRISRRCLPVPGPSWFKVQAFKSRRGHLAWFRRERLPWPQKRKGAWLRRVPHMATFADQPPAKQPATTSPRPPQENPAGQYGADSLPFPRNSPHRVRSPRNLFLGHHHRTKPIVHVYFQTTTNINPLHFLSSLLRL